MLVVFGNGRCPLCGDAGKHLESRVFLCSKCNVSFDEFLISEFEGAKKYADKHWN